MTVHTVRTAQPRPLEVAAPEVARVVDDRALEAAVFKAGAQFAKGVGFEYQLLDDLKHPDAQLHDGTRTTGSLYDVLGARVDKKLNPAGEWNSSRILVKGNHVEQWLNGVKTVEFEMGSEALKKAIAASKFKTNAAFGVKTKSPILLQDHGDEISLRALKIRVIAAQ